MLRAVIIDDEVPGIESLKILASRNPEIIKIVASTTKAEEGIILIEDYKPDIVFLDINMPTMDGFDLVAKLIFRDFKLIFITAHKDYAIQAIKHKAFDYLLKPVDDAVFRKCIRNIFNEPKPVSAAKKAETHSFIEVQVKDGILFLKQEEIVRLEASRSYTEFYMDRGIKHVASKSLKDFENKLDPNLFFRCHKSHIINLKKVQKFINSDGFFAFMNDGSKPLISKMLKDDFLKRHKEI